MDEKYEALRDQHRRLRAAAHAVVDNATAVGNRENPMAGIAPHILRDLRRELTGEPQSGAGPEPQLANGGRHKGRAL